MIEKLFVVITCIIFFAVLPILILIFGIRATIKERANNKRVFFISCLTAILFLLSLIPWILIIADEGLVIVAVIIVECYVTALVLPWILFFCVLAAFIKFAKRESSKVKIFFCSLPVLIAFILLCLGTFSGFLLDFVQKSIN